MSLIAIPNSNKVYIDTSIKNTTTLSNLNQIPNINQQNTELNGVAYKKYCFDESGNKYLQTRGTLNFDMQFASSFTFTFNKDVYVESVRITHQSGFNGNANFALTDTWGIVLFNYFIDSAHRTTDQYILFDKLFKDQIIAYMPAFSIVAGAFNVMIDYWVEDKI